MFAKDGGRCRIKEDGIRQPHCSQRSKVKVAIKEVGNVQEF